MTAYLLKRFLIGALTLVFASLVVFSVLEILPGDPARLMLGMNASEETVQVLREQMGLNQPLLLRYFDWARRASDARFREILHLFGSGHRPDR